MAIETNNKLYAEVGKRTKIETTYEYVPILGGILGFWKTIFVARLGHKIELHLRWDVSKYDVVFINGKEVKIRFKDEELEEDN